MPALPETIQFAKRSWCYGDDCSSTWNWARWILFVLFILGILFLIASAIRINKRRGLEGRQPIVGTAWITPPSYMQATQQQQQQEPYVPAYTAQANDQDLGYYDNQGNFVPNPKAQMANENGYRLNTMVPDQTGVSAPPPVQVTGQNPSDDFSRQFQRYYGTTQATTYTTAPATTGEGTSSSANNTTAEGTSGSSSDEFNRPPGPPPTAHTKS